jgi:hypothetical protein
VDQDANSRQTDLIRMGVAGELQGDTPILVVQIRQVGLMAEQHDYVVRASACQRLLQIGMTADGGFASLAGQRYNHTL